MLRIYSVYNIMRVKGTTQKVLPLPIRVVLVETNGVQVTHIYRSRESFRLDKLARYRKKVFRAMQVKPMHTQIRE